MSPWIPLFLALQITDLTPASSPTSGGGSLYIDTTSYCAPSCPATVTFDSQTVSATMFASRIIVDAVPPHERGVVNIGVNVAGDTGTAPLHYTTDDDFERVLIPLVVHRVLVGAYGAAWRIESAAANSGDAPADLWLMQDPGATLVPPSFGKHLGPHQAFFFNALLAPDGSGAIARVGKWVANDIAFSSRVVSQATGTSLPVVRESAFRKRFTIVDVAADAKSRLQVRIYSLADHPVTASVQIRPMAAVGDPIGTSVTIPAAAREVAGTTSLEYLAGAGSRTRFELTSDDPIWAMVSVTDNATNEVAIFWPQ